MTVKFDTNNAQYVTGLVNRLPAVTVRSGVTADDENAAAVYALGTGADCSECDIVEVEVSMAGSEGVDTFDLTPLVKAEGADSYTALYDQKRTVEFSEATIRKFRMTVGGNSDVNFLCDAKSGTSPTLATIKIIPLRGAKGGGESTATTTEESHIDAESLHDLLDVDKNITYTDGLVLRADGSKFKSQQLAHSDLSEIGENTHEEIDTHIADTTIHPEDSTLVHNTGDENVSGVKTFLSNPILPNDAPTIDRQAISKAYADALAQGFRFKSACDVATTEALPAADYDNGTLGEGATLTGQANGAIGDLDGYTVQLNDRVLVKNQAAPAQNGVYLCTTVGDAGTKYVLTRATDFDVAAEIIQGNAFLVLNGTANAATQWALTTGGTVVVGTTALDFAQISKPVTYVAGDGLDLTGATFSLDVKANDGLTITLGEVTINYDDASIGIVSNQLAIKALGVTNAMLAGAIADTKLEQITTAGKVSGAALTALASIPEEAGIIPIANMASGTPTGLKFVRDDGTLAIPPGGSADVKAAIIAVDIVSSPESGQAWRNMPAALTEIFNNPYGRLKMDLTYATHYRIVVNQSVAGAAGADFNLQYSTDNVTYVAADSGAAGELAVGTGTGVKVGAWAELVNAAKNDVWIRLVGKDGNGVADPVWRQIKVQFKISVPGLTLDDTLTDGRYAEIAGSNGIAGAALSFGQLCYLQTADSRWELADANVSACFGAKLGICVLAAAGDGSATRMLYLGNVNAASLFPSMTVGMAVYMSETPGAITSTQPTTADACIRVIGFANSADELYFCPSPDYITHSFVSPYS